MNQAIHITDGELENLMHRMESSDTSDKKIPLPHAGGNVLGPTTEKVAIDILRQLYPEENWTYFLARNRQGLTEGHPPIRYMISPEGIAYDAYDIIDFAETYGAGVYAAQTIRKVVQRVYDELEAMTKSAEGLEMLIGIGEISARKPGEKDAFRLTLDQAIELSEAMRESAEIQGDTSNALTKFAFALRAIAEMTSPMDPKELAAFVQAAQVEAARASENAAKIAGLARLVCHLTEAEDYNE